LCEVLDDTDPAEALQVLQAVLQQQAARSAGIVLVWANQGPEQLSSTFDAAYTTTNADSKCWYVWVEILLSILTKATTLDSSSAMMDGFITTITEQLDQSGRVAVNGMTGMRS
jgi:hypothetical protein